MDVVAWRWPHWRAVLIARSACDRCGDVLAPWEIVPVVSWLALRGRCRHCHAPISPRHVVTEAAGGLVAMVAGFWLP